MTNIEWNTLSFPRLDLSFPVYSDAFTVFGMAIKWYGILIAVGVLCALFYSYRRMKSVGIDDDRATDVIFWSFIGAVIGARLYYVLMRWDEYSGSFKDMIAIRDGGLAVYGGLIGAVLVACVVSKIKKIKLSPLLDLAGMGFLIGQAFGRWGNFFNHEAFGTNTNLPWGMTSPRIQASLSASAEEIYNTCGVTVDPTLPVHPCFLYESLWCVLGFVLLHIYFKHRKFDGEVFLLYIGWYGLGRAFIEGLRTDSLMLGHLRISQLVAGLCVVAAVVIIVAKRMKIRSDGEYVFYKDTEESKRLINETEEKYSKKASERKKSKKEERELRSEERLVDEEDKTDNEEDNKDGSDN